MQSRSAHGAHDEDDAQRDKRDTQELTHIERHVGFESHLIVFDKFDEESAGKQYGEEYTED